MSLLRSTSRRSALILIPRGLAFGLTLLHLLGCGDAKQMSDAERLRNQLCPPARASHQFEETPFTGSDNIVLSFQNIRSGINSACASCHQTPAKNGGFSYVDSWQGQEVSQEGKIVWLPGFFEAAPKMKDSIFHSDPEKRMPPPERRGKNPEAFLEIGRQLEAWINAGKPNGSFGAGKGSSDRRGKLRPPKPHRTSEVGDCIPTAKGIGFDYKLDRQFESLKALPKYLSDTDLFDLDPFVLAQHGTLAYSVEYPLWADNANKGRWIHVPMKPEDGQLKKQSIEYDFATKKFIIPNNTRFYKTFYRAVTLANKKIKMRRMETRLIVARTPWQDSLFGTYQWDESEQTATLVETPYRDGTPWKDLILDVVVDEFKGKMRPYAIPGRQRCIDCHMGSPSQNFILGLQPLQLNRRQPGTGGTFNDTDDDDVTQVDRFISYGVLTGIKSARDLPVLETSGQLPPRNDHELRANAYTVGNCFHCHNPLGLAFTKENGIQLALGPGEIFGFNTQMRSVQIATRKLVHQAGELDSSHIWRKISDSPAQLGMFSQMPMHTPGAPDCRVMTLIGRWIRSFENVQAADAWTPECKKENPFHWIDLDFTWVNSETYVPRRNDWKDPQEGMPEKYLNINLTSTLHEAIKSEYPVGYWLKKPECRFPVTELPPEKRRPWMMNGDKPKRPYGEIYSTTPGSYFFRNTCMKCHGPRADGDSALARGILHWSGGSVRVANLIDGMFDKQGENLKTFDFDGRNLAGQYLIWMAMEGTKVRFPPEVSSYMGKHGGQMLNGIREKCLAQVSTDKPSSPQFIDHEIFNRVCFMENLEPGHPDLKFDPSTNEPLHPDRLEVWLDRGAWNAGWAIFQFLKEAGEGHWRPANNECEKVYGIKQEDSR